MHFNPIKLKRDYVYNFIGQGIYRDKEEIVIVTKTFRESDVFHGYAISGNRKWDMNTKYLQGNWDVYEIGPKQNNPEYWL